MNYVYSFNQYSRGAKQLSEALAWRRIKHQGSKFKGFNRPWVLNWGATEVPDSILNCHIINHPEAVEETTDKLNFFRLMDGTGLTPEFGESREWATAKVLDGNVCVSRSNLRGHNGNGISIHSHVRDLPNVPLYVLYVKKKHEFRVHVFDNQIIDVQQKKRRTGVPDEEVDYQVRNYHNGFVYCRENIQVPDSVLDASLAAMAKTSLDFGAVDVIFNERQNKPYVLEINSAPGLEGSTIGNYSEAIRNFIEENL